MHQVSVGTNHKKDSNNKRDSDKGGCFMPLGVIVDVSSLRIRYTFRVNREKCLEQQ